MQADGSDAGISAEIYSEPEPTIEITMGQSSLRSMSPCPGRRMLTAQISDASVDPFQDPIHYMKSNFFRSVSLISATHFTIRLQESMRTTSFILRAFRTNHKCTFFMDWNDLKSRIVLTHLKCLYYDSQAYQSTLNLTCFTDLPSSQLMFIL